MEEWIVKDGGMIGPPNKPSVATALSYGTAKGDEKAKSIAALIVLHHNSHTALVDFVETVERYCSAKHRMAAQADPENTYLLRAAGDVLKLARGE